MTAPETATTMPEIRGLSGVQPLTCTIGVKLTEVNHAGIARDDEQFAELCALLLKYKVLFVRDQKITRAEHVALAQRFGPLEDHPMVESDPQHPGLIGLYKDGDSKHYENAFHCDAMFRECPPMGPVLRCVQRLSVGGDTIWVNMAEAYRRLPQAIKERIDGLFARHSFEATLGAAIAVEERHALRERFPDPEHPVVRTHR